VVTLLKQTQAVELDASVADDADMVVLEEAV
jgi:hypothetical protein